MSDHVRLKPIVYSDYVGLRKVENNKNQRTNGPANAHLISGPSISKRIHNLDKMAEQTLTLILITHNPSFTQLVYYINQFQVKECIYFKRIQHCHSFLYKSLSCKI